jgi:undecaprenyl-diphosphatase
VAVLAIKLFIEVIKKYGFKPWGYYRIVAGVILLLYFSLNK